MVNVFLGNQRRCPKISESVIVEGQRMDKKRVRFYHKRYYGKEAFLE